MKALFLPSDSDIFVFSSENERTNEQTNERMNKDKKVLVLPFAQMVSKRQQPETKKKLQLGILKHETLWLTRKELIMSYCP